MTHEKIFSRPDGSRIKIIVSLSIGGAFIKETVKWDYYVMSCAPQKRTWVGVADTDSYEYRALSMEDRKKRNEAEHLKVVSKEEIISAQTELWEKLKPT